MDFYDTTGQRNPSYDRRQVRREAKAKAFAAMREHKGKIFLATLAATLPSLLVTALAQWQSVQDAIAAYGSMQESTLVTATSSSNPMITLLIDLLTIFALMPLSIGLYHLFTVLLRREGEPSVNLIFSRFQSGSRYWLSVKLAVLVTVYSIFWSIPVTAVCIAPFLIAARGSAAGGLVWVIGGVILSFFMLLFYMAKLQSYEASYLISLDYEERRARELFFAARVLYNGHLFELMVFLLSFIGWYIAPVAVLIGLGVLAGLTLASSATLTVAMIILFAVAAIVVLIYCMLIGAYQNMAFICLTNELRVRSGDPTAMTPEQQQAYIKWQEEQGQQEQQDSE